MFKRTLITPSKMIGLGATLLAWSGAHANDDIAALRAELAQLKQQYEARLAELETRLAATPARPAQPAPAKGAATASSATPASGLDMSLILQGQYAHRKAIEERGISGFFGAGDHGHGSARGLSVDHTELVLSANIDPNWRGYATLALVDDAVELEEAWFQSIGLAEGLSLKGGRFYSGLGYLNEQHAHAWDFADAPLMYQALFGGRLAQDGVQLKWLAPTDTFLELGLEAARGQNFPGSEAGGDRNGAGAWSAFAKIGGDVGASHSWRAGLAHLQARPKDREGHWEDTDHDEVETHFSGTSRTWVADFVWKWAPDGNPKARNFKFQAEWFQRRESGNLSCLDQDIDVVNPCDGDPTGSFSSRQSGWYTQAVYQFLPRWRVGARYDRLDSGRMAFGGDLQSDLEAVDYAPKRSSLMLDYSPSEFARFRLQYAQDKSMAGVSENQWTLQYIHSLGAHGAHKF